MRATPLLLAAGIFLLPGHYAMAAKDDCQSLVSSGQKDKAMECFRAVLKKHPDDTNARNSIAALLAEQKKYQSALTEFTEVLKRKPNDGVALNGKAMMLIALNKVDEGFATLQKALEIDPKNVQALHNLALFNAHHGHDELAVPLWQRVLAISPDDPDALVGLGEVRMKQGKPDEALAFFNQVIEKDDKNAEAIYLAGKTIAQTRPVDAIPYLERAAFLTNQAEPWYDLGLARMFAGEWRLAGQAFTQATELSPDDYRFYLQIGKVNLEMHDYDDAITNFGEVMKLRPPPEAKVAVHFHLGLVREAQGSKQKALDEYQQALQLDPNHVASMLNIAVIDLQQKRLDPAKEMLDRVLALDPGNASAHFNLGRLLLLQGKTDAGKKELRALLATLPENDPLRKQAEELVAGSK